MLIYEGRRKITRILPISWVQKDHFDTLTDWFEWVKVTTSPYKIMCIPIQLYSYKKYDSISLLSCHIYSLLNYRHSLFEIDSQMTAIWLANKSSTDAVRERAKINGIQWILHIICREWGVARMCIFIISNFDQF